jgi:hypothetical protein
LRKFGAPPPGHNREFVVARIRLGMTGKVGYNLPTIAHC